MKKISVILAVLFAILLPAALLLTDVQLVAYDRDYYRSEYVKYRIPEHLGMTAENLMESTEQLLLYLENKRDNLNFTAVFDRGTEEFFSPRDKQHMIDVKGLFVKGYMIRNVSFLYNIFFLWFLLGRNKGTGFRRLAKCGIAAALVGITPVLILVVLMNLDFYKYFTVFHEIFFTNDLWLLDPATDRLINMFPQEFFTDMAFSISYLYIAEMAVILIGSMLILRYAKKAGRR